MDAYKNLAAGVVLTPPTPAASGTSLELQPGHGLRLPVPPFNLTIWAANTLPVPPNAEIVRVTAIAGDLLTITRAVEGTSARLILAGDFLAATITTKLINEQIGRASCRERV